MYVCIYVCASYSRMHTHAACMVYEHTYMHSYNCILLGTIVRIVTVGTHPQLDKPRF